MMLSLFYAKLFGLYLLIVVMLFASRRKQMILLIEDIFKSPPSLAITGIISLLLGLTIVTTHNIWDVNWRGIITLFGYLAIVKGIVRFGFPDKIRHLPEKILSGNSYWVILLVLLLIGIYLTYSGFSEKPMTLIGHFL